MNNFWDVAVWGEMNMIAALLLGLLAASLLKKAIKILKESLIPTAVLAGGLLLGLSSIYKIFGDSSMFDTPFFGGNGTSFLEIITYHALALGFIASTFESSDEKMSKQRQVEIFNSGVTTVATYLVQAIIGLGITLIAAKVMEGFFPAAGIILPFGYGQGTGQAMNYGNIYETQYGFVGGKSFGLTIAAFGFIVASLGGVLHLTWLRRRQNVKKHESGTMKTAMEKTLRQDEIPLFENMDTLSVQIAFIVGTYMITYVIIYILGELIPGLKSVIYGFNFLIGVLVTTGVKSLLKNLEQKKILKKHYVNDFLMVRIRNFCYDIMVVAGIAAIQLGAVGDYLWIILLICIVGAIGTFVYNRIIAKALFKDYAEEQFVAMYGMLTGTASTGIVLLRELDAEFKTPVSDNIVYQNFPAIVFGFPLMLIAASAPEAPEMTFLIVVAFFVALNIILFRAQLFGKFIKKK